MMSTNVVTRASVYLNSRYVGTLHYKGGRGSFNYEDLVPEHPTIGLRFEYNPDYGSRPEVSVPTWFANLLPERGSGLRKLYSRQLGRSEISDFLLLSYLGHDLPGAVRVEADGALPSQMVEALEIADADGRENKFSFSLSGMQLKFSMLQSADEFVLPDVGEYGDWIVKLPSDVYPNMPANEQAMMTWASAIGIDVPDHRLVTAEQLHGLPDGSIAQGDLAFAVRRFDRTRGGRVHQEDFAQILDAIPTAKDRGSHELIGRVILDECPVTDYYEYVRRLVFCIVSGNTDEHLKNWSLQYPYTRSARLSPAYDLEAVTSYSRFRNDRLTLPIAELDETRLLEVRHFEKFAETLGADVAETTATVRDTVRQLRSTWREVSNDPQLPEFVRDHIESRVGHLPLMQA
jgi:serine/threonine-protein kinase HipA